jgi:microcystin-dependent protein
VEDGVLNQDLLSWNGSNWIARAPSQALNSKHQPYQSVNFIIALEGIYPSRNAADPFIGEIVMFGGNFAPQGWALCDGQLLPITSNEALFSILGTSYGGDGRTTFGLPDLRGRVPVHAGTGPGLQEIRLGISGSGKGGSETH